MKRTALVVIAVLTFVVVLGATAYAQPSTFQIPFTFIAHGKTLPAGTYTIEQNMEDNPLALRQVDGKNEMLLEPMTRLAQQPPIADPKLIFDKVGTVYYLSEVWLPGKDGFLLQATKEKHEHHVIRARKGQK